MAAIGYRDSYMLQTLEPTYLAERLRAEMLIPGGSKVDMAQFLLGFDGCRVTATAAAAVDATSITVAALGSPIPINTILDFGGKKIAVLTASAAKGATSLTVRALGTALAGNETANYVGMSARKIAAGTVLGRTAAEVTAGNPFGAWDAVNDTEAYLTAFEVKDVEDNNDVSFLRPGCLIYPDRLWWWATATATEKTKLGQLYQLVTPPKM